jgi:hypothetical protein
MAINRILVALLLLAIAFQAYNFSNYVKFIAAALLLVKYYRFLNYLLLAALLCLYWISGCDLFGHTEYILFVLNASLYYFIIRKNKNFIDSIENRILILLVATLKILVYVLDLDQGSVSHDEITNITRYGLYAGDANYNSIIAVYLSYCAFRFKNIMFFKLATLAIAVFLFIIGGSKTIIISAFGFLIYMAFKKSIIISLSLTQLIWFYLISRSDAPTLSFRYELTELMFGSYSYNLLPNEYLFRELTKITYENYSVHSHSTLLTLLYDQGILLTCLIIYGVISSMKIFFKYNSANKLNIFFIYAMFSFAITNDMTYSFYAIYTAVILNDVPKRLQVI